LRVTEFHFGHPPLSQLFNTISGTTPARQAPSVTVPKLTTTSNGSRIITHDLGGAHSALGIFIEAGPKYDPLAAPGLSFALRWGMTTSNMENSLFQIDRTMRAHGYSYGTNEVNKCFIGLKIEGRRDMWEKPLQQLLIGVSVPRFAESDLERVRDTWDNQYDECRWQRPRDFVADMVETVAFLKQPLGNPRHILPSMNDKSSSKALLDQWASLCIPANVIVAGVNVEHDAIVAAFENNPYPHSAQAPHHARAPRAKITSGDEASQYTANCKYEVESRAKAMGTRPDMREDVAVAVAWLSNGAEQSAEAYAATLVAAQALDMIVAPTRKSETGLCTIYRPYSTAGLLGFTFLGEPESATAALKEAANAFAKPFNMAGARARALAKFQINHIEAARDYVDFIATSKFSEVEIVAALKSVSEKEVKGALDRARATKASLYGTGYTYGLPSPRQLQL
jgi:processing peptidase subunit alpha